MILLVILLPSVIDLTGYKDRIEGFLKGALDKDVFIREIRLSLLWGLGAELEDIRIGKDPELLSVDTMRIKVALLPLLQGKIEMKGVVLNNMNVFFKKTDGRQKMLAISKLYLPLTLYTGNRVEVKGIKADLYRGNMIGELKIEKGGKETRYSLVHSTEKIESELLIKDTFGSKAAISGPLKLEGNLKGMGNNMEMLEGSGFLNVGKGKVRGVELVDIIGSVGIITSKRPISLTDFDKISGHYTIGGGYLKTEDLEMVGKDLYLRANGSYGLINSRLDFLVKGEVLDIPLEIKISGTGSEPAYHLKARGLEKKAIEGVVKELGKGMAEKKGVEEFLKGLFKK